MSSRYDPIQTFKPVGSDIGIVDGPFEYLTMAGLPMPLPFTTRMTVMRLANGALFLHSPVAYDEALARSLRAIGDVRHLVSPNQWHYAHIAEWQRAFPDAVAWASPGVRRRARSRKNPVVFTADLGADAPPEWRDEIDQGLVPGGIFKEFVFFHRASQTLVLADTIMNFESGKLDQPWLGIARLTGMAAPSGGMFFGMRLPFALQRRQAQAIRAKLKAWKPRRIILSHGQCIETDVEATLARVFG